MSVTKDYIDKAQLKRYQAIMLDAKEQNINEADTVLRLVKMFEDVFGYDAFKEISREAQLRDKYVDLMIKIDGVPRLLIEVKAPTVALRDRQIEQAQSYASRNNYNWVLLTNGVEWNLYHLTFSEGIEYERAFHLDLSTDDINKCEATLVVLHRKSLSKGGLDDFWACQVALSPASISKALFHEDVLNAIRRNVKRETGRSMDIEDLADSIKRMFSQETRELIGPVKIRSTPKAIKKPAAALGSPPCSQGVPADTPEIALDPEEATDPPAPSG
ncbi:MAG: type I restriction enzyme HsdR N-terminal domain-containing protein [Methanomassiliicoccus sp.]|nr:type I restriction enzyme HsdR N-terminal domain-containing protein [Methanomassiliicoccus sp.]